jgi:Flp pilus assembly protein protease CpaA
MDSVQFIQAIMCITYAVAGIQDLRWREVSDLTWLIGLAMIPFYLTFPVQVLAFVPVKLAIMVLSAVLMLRFGAGEADAIAVTLLAFDPSFENIFITLLIFLAASLPLMFLPQFRRKTVTVQEALDSTNLVPVSVFVDGKEVPLPGDVDKAIEALKAYRKSEDAKVLAEKGVPFISLLSISYTASLVLTAFLGF